MNIQLDVSNKGIQKIQSLITSKLYSNTSTWIVELVSNALDAYKRAGKEAQILFYSLSLKDEQTREILNISRCIPSKNYYVVSDKALGLSKEDFIDKICTVPKSDKDDGTNEGEIGSFGIGSLSVFAYSKNTYWQTVKDDKVVIFHLYEDLYTGLQYEILEERDNTEGLENGIKVFVEIPDFYKPIDANRLKFIKNLLTENSDYLEEKKKIYENHLFKCISDEVTTNRPLKILINDIVYDLDFKSLNVIAINFPVYLKFNSDEVDIQPTRENLIYNQKTVTNILDKIQELRNWYETTWLEQNKDKEYNIINYSNQLNNIFITLSNQHYAFKLRITNGSPDCNLFRKKEIEDTFQLLYPIKKDIFIYVLHNVKFENIYRKKYCVNRNYSVSTLEKKMSNNGFKVLINSNPNVDFTIKRKRLLDVYKQIYSQSLNHPKEGVVFYSKKETRSLNYYKSVLYLESYHKSEWRDIIRFFQSQLDFYEKVKFELLENYPEKIEEKEEKDTQAKKALQQKIKKVGDVQLMRKPSRSCDSLYVLDKTNIEYNTKNLYVYDHHVSEKLEWLYLLNPKFKKAKLNCIIIKQKQMSDLLEGKENIIGNVIHVDDLFKQRHSALLKSMTASMLNVKVSSLFLDNLDVLDKYSEFIKEYISTDLMNEYFYFKTEMTMHSYYINSELQNKLVAFAEENKLYDEYLFNLYYKLKNMNDQLYFLEYFMDNFSRKQLETKLKIINDVREFCKNRMIRYKIDLPLNPKKVEINESVEENEDYPF